MSQGTFLAFAYGSNMPTARLLERCPSAEPIGVAELKGFELRWHKRSKDGSGKCDIVSSSSPEARVLGVLYQVSADEQPALARAEGKGYAEIEVEVVHAHSLLKAKAYQATDLQEDLVPYTWYRALVVAGAREHGLPASYIAELEVVSAKEDPDRNRHEKNMRLISEVSA